MPDHWDAEQYRERAKQWRDRAASVPEGHQRDAYLALAVGYEELAEAIDANRRPPDGRSDSPP
jgi:hypothetical protein